MRATGLSSGGLTGPRYAWVLDVSLWECLPLEPPERLQGKHVNIALISNRNTPASFLIWDVWRVSDGTCADLEGAFDSA